MIVRARSYINKSGNTVFKFRTMNKYEFRNSDVHRLLSKGKKVKCIIPHTWRKNDYRIKILDRYLYKKAKIVRS